MNTPLLLAAAVGTLFAPSIQAHAQDATTATATASGTETSRDSQDVLQITLAGKEHKFSRAELRDWLIHYRGPNRLNEFAQCWAIHRACEIQGMTVTPEQTRAKVQADIDTRIATGFNGSKAAWLSELELVNRTEKGFWQERLSTAQVDLELENLVRVETVVTEEDVVTRWEKRYGPVGISWDCEVISLRFIQPTGPRGSTRDEQETLRKQEFSRVMGQAQKVQEALQAGAEFQSLFELYADDPVTRDLGGRFEERFPPPNWPKNERETILAAKAGDVLEPVFTGGSIHVVKLIAPFETPLNSVRDTLYRELEQEPANAQVMLGKKTELFDTLDLQLQPGWTKRRGPADEALFTINSNSFNRTAFGDWLIARYGDSDSSIFAEHVMVERRVEGSDLAAEAAKITVADTRQRVLDNMDRMISEIYNGDRDQWWRSLTGRFETEEDYIQHMTPATMHQLRCEALYKTERVVSDQEVRQRWLDSYGPDGVRFELRLIQLDVNLPALGDGTKSSLELKQREDNAFAEVIEEGKKIIKRLENGEDFGALAKRYSTHIQSAQKGGRPENFDRRFWPERMGEALEEAQVGDYVGPVKDHLGYHIFIMEVLDREEAPYEKVVEDLRTRIRTERPTASERSFWMNTFTRGMKVMRLPAMYAE